MSVKVHKVTVLVVDHDNLGAEGIKNVLHNTHYPNHCLNPQVMDVQTTEVEWDDSHPLNRSSTQEEEFQRLFAPSPE